MMSRALVMAMMRAEAIKTEMRMTRAAASVTTTRARMLELPLLLSLLLLITGAFAIATRHTHSDRRRAQAQKAATITMQTTLQLQTQLSHLAAQPAMRMRLLQHGRGRPRVLSAWHQQRLLMRTLLQLSMRPFATSERHRRHLGHEEGSGTVNTPQVLPQLVLAEMMLGCKRKHLEARHAAMRIHMHSPMHTSMRKRQIAV